MAESGTERRDIRPWTKRVRTGTFRHRITLQEQNLTADGYGGTTQSWVEIGQFWADIRPMSVREILAARQGQTLVDTRIVMRNPGNLGNFFSVQSNVNRTLRIVYGQHTYKLQGTIEHGDILEIVCIEEQEQT